MIGRKWGHFYGRRQRSGGNSFAHVLKLHWQPVSSGLNSTPCHWQVEIKDEVQDEAATEPIEDDAVLALCAFSKLLAEHLLICFSSTFILRPKVEWCLLLRPSFSFPCKMFWMICKCSWMHMSYNSSCRFLCVHVVVQWRRWGTYPKNSALTFLIMMFHRKGLRVPLQTTLRQAT